MNTPEQLLELLKRVQKVLYNNPDVKPIDQEFLGKLREDVDVCLCELKIFISNKGQVSSQEPETPKEIDLDKNEVNDDWIIPFGKYRGKKLRYVPATYLDWLRGEMWVKERYSGLWKYITEGSSSRSINQDLEYD